MAILAALTGLIFTALSALHIYWAFGGTWGIEQAVPKINGAPAFTPGRSVTLIVAAGLLFLGLLAVGLGHAESMPEPALFKYAGIAAGIVLAARAVGDLRLVGIFKTVKDSEFAKYDTRYYVPLCLFLSAVFFALSL